MAKFQDLGEFFDDTLTLPIGGVDYVIPSPSAELGLAVEALVMRGGRITDADLVLLSDDEERDLYGRLLGSAWDAMLADKVAWSRMQHAGKTTMIWVAMGQEAAERAWLGKALAPVAPELEPNRADKRAAKRVPSTRTAGASATPAPVSTSGTRSRKPTKTGSARTASRTKTS